MRPASQLTALVLLLSALPASVADVPAQIPDPDGKPGDASKPVKVYILAGQAGIGQRHVEVGPFEQPVSDNGPKFVAKGIRRWLVLAGVSTLFIARSSS